MFDADKWQEIWHTMRKNPLRTFLTAFGVFWGIFMLIIMLGSGNGLKNGVQQEMFGYATNSLYLWGGKTTMPYNGLKPGRWVRMTTEDITLLENQAPEIEYLAPRNQLGGWRGGNNVSRGSKTGAYSVMGDYPAIRQIQSIKMLKGRFLNNRDLDEKRKIAVVGEAIVEELFEPGEDPIGKSILIQGVYFQVVGVFTTGKSGDEAQRDKTTIFIPFTTFSQAFNMGNGLGWFAMTAAEGYSAAELEQKVKTILAERHDVHPEDLNAFGSYNAEENFKNVQGLFGGIRIFIWVVGIGTLMAGIIGVSNIMLIVVKERTKEIGVRKALGATPISIISLVIMEALVLTAVAGYSGLVLGVFALEGVAEMLNQGGGDAGIFRNPEVDLKVAIQATLILIFSGALAGLIPARMAARVNPVEALRTE